MFKGGWNTSSYDLVILVSNGLLAVLGSTFHNLQVVKKGSSYLSIIASSQESQISLRFVDFMQYQGPSSLENYLKSFRSVQSLSTGEDKSQKAVIPYWRIGAAVNADGEDSGYSWTLDDFNCQITGRNSLDEERRTFQGLLQENGGNEELTLHGLGLTAPPPPAHLVFQRLQESWTKQGLHTAKQVLDDYQVI